MHQVLYESVESLYCTPETNITLYVNQLEFKLKKKEKNGKAMWIFLEARKPINYLLKMN